MPFWQTIALVLVVSCALGGLLVLATRLAIVRAAAVAGSPAASTPHNAGESAAALTEAIADVGVLRAEWRAYQKHLDAYLEAFNDLEETVEHKRRRTTAAASRIQREKEEPAPPENGTSALLARARGMGLPV